MIDLAERRRAVGITQVELADRVGVVYQAISNIETGRTKPSIKTAKAIAQVLNFKWAQFYE